MSAKWAFIRSQGYTKLLRQKGHLNAAYIDDSYLQGRDTEECLLNISDTQTLFTRLGFVINRAKSSVIPAQRITFLANDVTKVTSVANAINWPRITALSDIRYPISVFVCGAGGILRDVPWGCATGTLKPFLSAPHAHTAYTMGEYVPGL